ncbi:hypothetical protein Aduo_018009 [Ancylostoma duodenale]
MNALPLRRSPRLVGEVIDYRPMLGMRVPKPRTELSSSTPENPAIRRRNRMTCLIRENAVFLQTSSRLWKRYRNSSRPFACPLSNNNGNGGGHQPAGRSLTVETNSPPWSRKSRDRSAFSSISSCGSSPRGSMKERTPPPLCVTPRTVRSENSESVIREAHHKFYATIQVVPTPNTVIKVHYEITVSSRSSLIDLNDVDECSNMDQTVHTTTTARIDPGLTQSSLFDFDDECNNTDETTHTNDSWVQS